jgi:hypothetical protein
MVITRLSVNIGLPFLHLTTMGWLISFDNIRSSSLRPHGVISFLLANLGRLSSLNNNGLFSFPLTTLGRLSFSEQYYTKSAR